MTESTKTINELVQELNDKFTQLADEAEKRRKTAGVNFEYYKFEFADGEKHAYQDAATKLKKVLDKI